MQVVALGIVPNLLPGVGLPAEKRSKFLQYLLQTSREVPILEVCVTILVRPMSHSAVKVPYTHKWASFDSPFNFNSPFNGLHLNEHFLELATNSVHHYFNGTKSKLYFFLYSEI